MNDIHVFCPTFPTLEMQGTFTFDNVTFEQVNHILRHGAWHHPETDEEIPLHPDPLTPLQPAPHWRHTWIGIQRMFNYKGFAVPSEISRRGYGAGGYQVRMQVGDVGIICRTANKEVELKSSTLKPRDFNFITVERVG